MQPLHDNRFSAPAPGGSSPNYFWFTAKHDLGFQHFSYTRKFVYPARLQDEYGIVICLAGQIFVSEENRCETLRPGEILIGNSRQWRTSRYGEHGHCEGLTVVVDRKMLQALLRDIGDDPQFEDGAVPVFPGTRRCKEVIRIAEDAINELAGCVRGRSQILEVLAQEILIRSLRLWPDAELQAVEDTGRLLGRRQYVSALDYMQSRSKNEFSVEEMCRLAGLSVPEFSRLFRRCTAQTPLATYNRLLMDRATTALREGAGSVKEVAYSLGFDSVSHFTALFRRTMNLPPSQVRPRQSA